MPYPCRPAGKSSQSKKYLELKQRVDGSAAGVEAASAAAAEPTKAAGKGVKVPCGECAWAGCALGCWCLLYCCCAVCNLLPMMLL
jgi:hypothetical protein